MELPLNPCVGVKLEFQQPLGIFVRVIILTDPV